MSEDFTLYLFSAILAVSLVAFALLCYAWYSADKIERDDE